MATKKRPDRTLQNPAQTSRLPAFLDRHARSVALAAVLLGSIRIAATYTVFNHTVDEPAHIACGMEFLDRHTYRYEVAHPPFARVAMAIGPYLLGIRSQGTPNTDEVSKWREGTAIFYRDRHYDLTLSMSRLGILPFFWLACLALYLWGRRWTGPAAAAASIVFFTFLPPVLAHSGLATNDMALTGCLGLAFATAAAWAADPDWKRGALFGLSAALAILSKFSSLVFFPAAAAISMIWHCAAERPRLRELILWARDRIPSLAVAAGVGCLVIWSAYLFSFGPTPFTRFRMPAPELFAGIDEVSRHNARGHPSYLLGEFSMTGFWRFYPVALAVKTPLACLALFAAGLSFADRRSLRMPLAFAAGVLAVAMTSRINIGVRYILPVYLSISLVASAGALRLIELGATRRAMRIACLALLAWFAGSSLWSHPHYLAYFNELAGGEPEKILVDSDLDWGQDLKRLARRLTEVGAPSVSIAGLTVIDLKEHGFPPASEYDMRSPNPGWNAVGFSWWKARRMGLLMNNPEYRIWPDRVPPGERVGKSMMLWYFAPPGR